MERTPTPNPVGRPRKREAPLKTIAARVPDEVVEALQAARQPDETMSDVVLRVLERWAQRRRVKAA
jgi:hypothetical protein